MTVIHTRTSDDLIVRWTAVLAFALLSGFCLAPSASAQQVTQPLVAILDSETTRALTNLPASGQTPNTTGNQWWETDWNYFVMPDSLKEAFRSDGTAFTVIGDSNVTSGLLLASGAPKYPIVFALSSECVTTAEAQQLTNYVAAGGYLFMSGPAFTRSTNGTSLGDFAIANQMGVHMVVAGMTNWAADYSFTRLFPHTLVSHIPDGSNTWRLPAYSEEINWGISPVHNYMNPHDQWQITASDATVVAMGDVYPYLTVKPYGKGYFIYEGAFNPLVSHGGFGPGMYSYVILRHAVEWAFTSANLPVTKLSPWPYQNDATFIMRHDLEDYANEMADIQLSAQVEASNGVRGDYYLCTGTVRVDMTGLGYNTNTVIQSMRTAMTSYGATISSHNGGLKNPDNSGLVSTNYDYWHWGTDEALDATPSGYPNGTAYATASLSNSFNDIETWLSGLMKPSMRLWVACNFNATREASYSLQSQLNVKILGDQKISPFPHWTLSTQTPDKLYPMLTEPSSEWFVGGALAQSLEPWHPPGVQTNASLHTAIDFYYNLGTLINFYSHTLTTGEGDAGQLTPDCMMYSINTNIHPRLWVTNAIGIYEWWLSRSNVQVNVSYATNGFQSSATYTIKGATDPNTAIELLTPGGLGFCSLSVVTNGVLAGTNGYRIVNNQLIRVKVGSSVTNAVISYDSQGLGAMVFSQNFDSVTAPGLPTGWTTSASGGESPWITVTSTNDTAPNSVSVPDPATVGLSTLTSPPIVLPSGPCQLSFRNNFNFDPGPGQSGFDGGILQIKIGTNAFVDIIAAGGVFVSGGYVGSIATNTSSPIAGARAWCESSDGFETTIIDLPPAALGQTNQFQWVCGTDMNNGTNVVTGWQIDSITISNLVCESCPGGTNAPVLPVQTNQTILLQSQLTVTNTATDANSVTYTLLNPPAGAVISQSGVITWTPSAAQSPSTNTFTTTVNDCGGSSASNSFQVIVYGSIQCGYTPVFSENFDEVTAPALPTGWTTTATGVESNWVTTTSSNNTSPNSAFVPDVPNIGLSQLVSPAISIPTGSCVLTFKNDYNLEIDSTNSNDAYDGGVLEIKIGTGAFTDIITAGGSFISGGYNAVINSTFGNQLAGRSAWSGNSGGFITTSVSLPSAATGQSVQFRWSCGSDNSNAKTGWWIDTITVSNGVCAAGGVLLTQPSNQTVNELNPVTVTNAASEPANPSAVFTYQLSSPPAGATINSNGVITWTPAQTQSPSTNTITTIATDNSSPVNFSATNSFTVTVKEVNVAPVLPIIGTQTVNEQVPLTVTNTATEPNIHATTTGYKLISPQTGMAISGGGIFTWTPSQGQSPGSYTVTTVVTNSDTFDTVNPQLKATNTFTVVVKEVNIAPVLPVIGAQTVNEQVPLTVTNTATEPNIHATTTGYGLISPQTGMVISGSGIFTWTPSQGQSPGSYTVTTVVTNSDTLDTVNPVLTATNSFSVTVKEVNIAPVLPVIGAQTVNEQVPLTVTNTATEPNIHATTTGYGLISPQTGMVISGSGIFTWTPSQGQSPGSYTVTTVVTNSDTLDTVNPVLTATNSFSVTVKEVNIAPVLPVIGAQTVNEQVPLTVTNTATEPNIHATTTGYGLISPQTGMVISGSGIFTWTPSQGQSPGSYTVTTVVNNSDPQDTVNPVLTATNSFSVTVKEVNIAPVLANIGAQAVTVLSNLTVTNTATEPNIHATTTGYGLIASPYGMNISSDGIITWTPGTNQAGNTVQVTTVVTNSDTLDTVNPTLTTTNTFSVTVNGVHNGPSLGQPTNATINDLTTLIVTNTATDNDIPLTGLTYQLVSPPVGATIDGNGIISWSPTAAQSPSTNLITTVVTDGASQPLSATNRFTIFVGAPVTPPIILSIGVTNSVATITWSATTSHVYRLQFQNTGSTNWTEMPANITTTNGTTASATNSCGGSTIQFYRVSDTRVTVSQ